MRHLPDWFPGAGFKRNAAIWKKKMEEFVDEPYAFVLNERVCSPFSPVLHIVDMPLCVAQGHRKGVVRLHGIGRNARQGQGT